MIKGLEFVKDGMSFQEMIDEADKSAVSRRAFVSAVGAALAAGVALKPDEAYAWNSYNSKISGPAYSFGGLADCVHEDITQIAYAYALHKICRDKGTRTIDKKRRNGSTYEMKVPDFPGGLLNPWRPHSEGPNGQAPCFQEEDLEGDGMNNYDPLPNSMYAENVAFLRMGAFWNDSACDSIADFMYNYARKDNIEQPDKKTYDNVYDVACHMLKDQKKESEWMQGSALIRFSMGERASFIHAMQAFQPDATTPLPQGLCRQMMLQWLGVAWEYARTGNPDGIAVEGLRQDQCRTIFDAFIDIYHQCYKTWGWKDSHNDEDLVCENWPLEDLLAKHGNKGDYQKYGHPGSLKQKEHYGYGGPNPLNIREMECRSIPLPERFLRLRALGMFAHTIEDSWCASHCSRTYPTADDKSLKYQIVGFNYYYRQKGSGSGSKNRHSPYDQVCEVDLKNKSWANSDFENKNNLRQILTYNPEDPWYKKWDFCDWFPSRYFFYRGTNKLYNIAPGEYISNYKTDERTYKEPEHGIEYEIFSTWDDRDNYRNVETLKSNFNVSIPVGHDNMLYDFKTLGLSEAVNTMAALFRMFMEDTPWSEVREWLLRNTLKCAFKDDDEDLYNNKSYDVTTDKALNASSWICTGGRRSLDSGRLLLGNVKKLTKQYGRLDLADFKTLTLKYGLTNPEFPIQNYINWEDWAAKFFNEYNDGTAQCKPVDKEKDSFSEEEGMEFVKKSYNSLAACLKQAEAVKGKDEVVKIVGTSEMMALQQVLEDLAGVYNEFVIQKTGAFPTSENSLSTASASGEHEDAIAMLADGETLLSDGIPTDLQSLFAAASDSENEEGVKVKKLLVSTQAIGTPQAMDLETSISPEEDAVKFRPYIFTDMESLQPFQAWAEVDSDADKKLMGYGEKAAGVYCTFSFFTDNVYGADYECVVGDVEYLKETDKGYRVFGEVVSFDSTSLTLSIKTLNVDGEFTEVTETFPLSEAESGLELGLEQGDLVNVLLMQSAGSDQRVVTAFDAIDNVVFKDGDSTEGEDGAEDFFSELTYSNIVNAPVYDVFSNSVSLVSGEIDPADSGSIQLPHAYAYYQEGGNESTKYEEKYATRYSDVKGEYVQVMAKYDEETGTYEEAEWDDDKGEYVDTTGYEPLAYYQEAQTTTFTLVSTVSFEQGIMCDIPMQCDDPAEVEDGGEYRPEDDYDVSTAYTMSALVYQDSTIQDTKNMTHKTHFTKGAPSEDAEEPQFEKVEQYNDPLYLSYLAVGMADNHADVCTLPHHCVSDGAGKHAVLCDDYIVHGVEDCVDEDGNLCTESCKPCVKCGYQVGGAPVYRLYNPASSEHLWTTSANEYHELTTHQSWTGEGTAWISPLSGDEGTVGVYRMYNRTLGTHHYTASENEAKTLFEHEEWQYDHYADPLFWAYPKTSDLGRPVYRLYNEALAQHHLTVSDNERKTLATLGWTDEGIAFRVLE